MLMSLLWFQTEVEVRVFSVSLSSKMMQTLHFPPTIDCNAFCHHHLPTWILLFFTALTGDSNYPRVQNHFYYRTQHTIPSILQNYLIIRALITFYHLIETQNQTKTTQTPPKPQTKKTQRNERPPKPTKPEKKQYKEYFSRGQNKYHGGIWKSLL